MRNCRNKLHATWCTPFSADLVVGCSKCKEGGGGEHPPSSREGREGAKKERRKNETMKIMRRRDREAPHRGGRGGKQWPPLYRCTLSLSVTESHLLLSRHTNMDGTQTEHRQTPMMQDRYQSESRDRSDSHRNICSSHDCRRS